MKKGQHLLITILLNFSAVFIYSQQATIAMGGDASSNAGSIAFTVGNLTNSSSGGANGSISQSIQSPYQINDLTGGKVPEIQLYLNIFPNPVNDYLILEVDRIDLSSSYALYDLTGKIIISNEILQKKTYIYMKNYVKNIYFLKIYRNKTLIKSFKIIKH